MLRMGGVSSFSANGTSLTEGLSFDDESLRPGPLVSAYPLAEWLAWNWWRLTREATPSQVNRHWAFAHRLSSIGGGYRWPNLELVSDGERVRLFSAPSLGKHFQISSYAIQSLLVNNRWLSRPWALDALDRM